jgi:hypothetical protein
MYLEKEIDPRLLKWFKSLEEVPPSDALRYAAQRANFLDEAQKLAPAVSKSFVRRQNGWKLPVWLIPKVRQEHKPMFQIFSTLLLAITLLLGAGGITTFAAQDSLPDEPLYALKLWSEETRLSLADHQQDWLLAMEFAERRAAEIGRMVENDQVPPEALQVRLRQQVEQAIRLAVSRPDDEARQALEQVRLRLEEQDQKMVMLQGGLCPQAEAALIRARETIRERIRWAESGIQEPNQLREHFRLRLQKPEITPGAQEQHRYSGTAAPGGPNQHGAGECPNCTPQGPQNGGNPWTTGTPPPGSGYGEGQGGNLWTTGTPTPGSGYGPGPGPGSGNTCTPQARHGSDSKPNDQPGAGPGPNPTDQPEKDPGLQPTDQPGMGPGPQPDQEDGGDGGQHGQDGSDPQATSPAENGGKP